MIIEISKDGTVWSNRNKKKRPTKITNSNVMLTVCKNGQGYDRRVDKFVLKVWGEYPEDTEDMILVHKDGDFKNNHIQQFGLGIWNRLFG